MQLRLARVFDFRKREYAENRTSQDQRQNTWNTFLGKINLDGPSYFFAVNKGPKMLLMLLSRLIKNEDVHTNFIMEIGGFILFFNHLYFKIKLLKLN